MKTWYSLLFVVAFLTCQQGIACRSTVHLKKYAKPGDDVTEVLQELVNKYKTVIIDEGEWLLSHGIKVKEGTVIKGKSAHRSVLKRNGNAPLKGDKLFYTERVNTDTYSKKDSSDQFESGMVKYRKIRFENLTIDFNRSPLVFSDRELKKHNLYGIALIHAADVSVKNCHFIDCMTAHCNNGYPAIVIYQSEGIKVENNVSDGVTFVQVIYSRGVSVSDNHCSNSVGTAIEFISGFDHKCTNNVVDTVFWRVSCIGVNSTGCLISGNSVVAGESNISCLTLGHEHFLSRADSSIVENNVLRSAGCRSLIIQNGCGITINNNVCSCVIRNDAPEMTSGSIVACGNANNIHDIKILNNTLSAAGNGNRGCITYRGTGHLLIENNRIAANRGVSILSVDNCDVEIVGNMIDSRDYAITANNPKLRVCNNTLKDGVLINAVDLEICNNNIEHTNHYSFLGKRWDSVIIKDNSLSNSTGRELPYGFLLDGSEKNGSYDEHRVVVSDNKEKTGHVKDLISVSGSSAAPQLKMVKNVNNR